MRCVFNTLIIEFIEFIESHIIHLSKMQKHLRVYLVANHNNYVMKDIHCATHYIFPKFRNIQTPKLGVHNYEQRLNQSVVGDFLCAKGSWPFQ